MGIISVKETKTGRGAAWSVQGGRTYEVELYVQTDDADIGPRGVILGLGLAPAALYRFPITTTATEVDPAAFLQSVTVGDFDEDGLGCKVKLSYAPYDAKTEGGATGAAADSWIVSPFSAPPTLRWASEDEDLAVTHDRAGEPILNKAGDPFDPPLVVPFSTPVATVTRVEKSFDPEWITYFKNSVNSAEWLGWPAESVMVKDITGDRVYDPDWGWLWNVSYTFAFRPKLIAADDETVIQAGWSPQVLNAGLRELKDGQKKPIEFDGAPSSSPVPLKNDGSRASPTDDPVFLVFDVFRSSDFDLLNMPTNLFTASTP